VNTPSLAALTLLLIGAAAATEAEPAASSPPAADRELGRSILKELVEINTNHEHGSTEAANAIARRLLSSGFAAGDVVVVVPPAHPTKGNVVVRYHGAAGGTPVLFLGHLDVVDAKREDWSVDPFKLTEQDGWFYGRGTIDMKDGDAALLEALVRLRREGYVPAHDLIAAFTADEEAGGDANGPEFLLKEHRALVEAGLVINLDGGGGAFKNGRRVLYEIGTSEKTYVTYTIETTSPGGHGSLPDPTTPSTGSRAASAARGLQVPVAADGDDPRQLQGTRGARAWPRQRGHAGGRAGPARCRGRRPPESQRLLQRAIAHDLRRNAGVGWPRRERAAAARESHDPVPMMPGDSAEHVQAALVATLNDPRITVTLDAPPIVSPESPLTRGCLAGSPPSCTRCGGNSDRPGDGDRLQRRSPDRNAGMPSYDASGIWIEMDENRAHGRDERVGQQAFDESVEYTYRLVKAMGSPD